VEEMMAETSDLTDYLAWRQKAKSGFDPRTGA